MTSDCEVRKWGSYSRAELRRGQLLEELYLVDCEQVQRVKIDVFLRGNDLFRSDSQKAKGSWQYQPLEVFASTRL